MNYFNDFSDIITLNFPQSEAIKDDYRKECKFCYPSKHIIKTKKGNRITYHCKCGNRLARNYNYCWNCGRKLFWSFTRG